MSDKISQRIQTLKALAKDRAAQDMQAIRKAKWQGMITERSKATRMVSRSFKQLTSFIDNTEPQLSGSPDRQEAQRALAILRLDTVQFIIERKASPEIRLAHFQGYSKSIDHQEKEFHKLAEISADLKSFAAKAKATSNLLKEISINPIKFYDVAKEFISGKVAKAVPEVLVHKLPSIPSTEKFIAYLLKKNVISEDFLSSHNIFKNAAKFFGILQIGFAITTVVFETLANQHQWASKLASATVAVGAGIALSSVITGTVVTSVITASLTAAGVTAEVPPVAAALIAAGIVIVSAIAITALFDSLIDLIFDIEDIPRGMRLSMSSQMFTSMSSELSSVMSSSMISIPK